MVSKGVELWTLPMELQKRYTTLQAFNIPAPDVGYPYAIWSRWFKTASGCHSEAFLHSTAYGPVRSISAFK